VGRSVKVSERMRKERKHYSAEEKVAILRRHLLDEVPVSDLGVLREQQCPPKQATGYITPKDSLVGRQQEIHAERDPKQAA